MLAWTGLLAAARWPRYWQWIAPELTPMTFSQALLLGWAALLAALLAILARLHGRPTSEGGYWTFLAAALVFLMLDERFAVHERVRDGLLAGYGTPVPWGAPGDYLLLLYAVPLLAALPGLARLLRPTRAALVLFGSGVVLAGLTVLADTVDIGAMTPATERIAQSVEETVEGVADALITGGLLVRLCARLPEG
jgi:hypothetical protein